MSETEKTISGILNFCFEESSAHKWFVKDPAFDAEVSARFAGLHDMAAEGKFDHWRETGADCLALCILLDQVPRNLFRDDPRAFATDAAARAITRHALDRKLDGSLTQLQRSFLYLPLEHSENLADQEECVRLFTHLDENPEGLDYAVRHRNIVARFGRFPHRNVVLGRESTPEEIEFLIQPGSSF